MSIYSTKHCIPFQTYCQIPFSETISGSKKSMSLREKVSQIRRNVFSCIQTAFRVHESLVTQNFIVHLHLCQLIWANFTHLEIWYDFLIELDIFEWNFIVVAIIPTSNKRDYIDLVCLNHNEYILKAIKNASLSM